MASTLSRRLVRVFLDSSVLIAAAISSRGAARDLLMRGLRTEILLCVSDLVLEESEGNLRLKAPAALPAFQLFRPTLETCVVRPSRARILRVAAAVHVKDAPIVAGAIAARARLLATYDRRHLLNQKDVILSQFGVSVATPDEILALL